MATINVDEQVVVRCPEGTHLRGNKCAPGPKPVIGTPEQAAARARDLDRIAADESAGYQAKAIGEWVAAQVPPVEGDPVVFGGPEPTPLYRTAPEVVTTGDIPNPVLSPEVADRLRAQFPPMEQGFGGGAGQLNAPAFEPQNPPMGATNVAPEQPDVMDRLRGKYGIDTEPTVAELDANPQADPSMQQRATPPITKEQAFADAKANGTDVVYADGVYKPVPAGTGDMAKEEEAIAPKPADNGPLSNPVDSPWGPKQTSANVAYSGDPEVTGKLVSELGDANKQLRKDLHAKAIGASEVDLAKLDLAADRAQSKLDALVAASSDLTELQKQADEVSASRMGWGQTLAGVLGAALMTAGGKAQLGQAMLNKLKSDFRSDVAARLKNNYKSQTTAMQRLKLATAAADMEMLRAIKAKRAEVAQELSVDGLTPQRRASLEKASVKLLGAQLKAAESVSKSSKGVVYGPVILKNTIMNSNGFETQETLANQSGGGPAKPAEPKAKRYSRTEVNPNELVVPTGGKSVVNIDGQWWYSPDEAATKQYRSNAMMNRLVTGLKTKLTALQADCAKRSGFTKATDFAAAWLGGSLPADARSECMQRWSAATTAAMGPINSARGAGTLNAGEADLMARELPSLRPGSGMGVLDSWMRSTKPLPGMEKVAFKGTDSRGKLHFDPGGTATQQATAQPAKPASRVAPATPTVPNNQPVEPTPTQDSGFDPSKYRQAR